MENQSFESLLNSATCKLEGNFGVTYIVLTF